MELKSLLGLKNEVYQDSKRVIKSANRGTNMLYLSKKNHESF